MSAEAGHDFGTLLKLYREAAGLSQEELAERAGMSRSAISALERGLNRKPHRDTVRLLADALQLGPAARAMLEAARVRGRVSQPRRVTLPESVGIQGAQSAPLVGRAGELGRLEGFLASGAPPLLVLTGEPGIGKSRLLREAAARARETGWTVLEGGCQRRAGQPPFAPLLEAVARHLEASGSARLRSDLQGAVWLVRLIPELAGTVEAPAPHWALPPEQERRLMFDSVARYLANIAGPAGTLLVLDDLQWAGTDALDLVGFLTARARLASGPPLLLLGAYRSTEVSAGSPLSHLVADLGRDGLAGELAPGPLAAEEARSLLEGMLEGTDRREALIGRLLERAEGVPFYLVSCVRAALAEAERDGAPRWAGNAVPWDAAQSIRQRIALLPDAAAELLGGAAVAGRQIERAILEALAAWIGLERGATAGALEAALHSRLLQEDGDSAYRFAHDLIREVMLTDLGAWPRRAAHRVIAEALEAHLVEKELDERAAEVALHFARGGEIPRALPYLERAGGQALARYANAEAERIFRELLRHYEALGRPLEAARTRERLGGVLTLMAQHDEALAVLTPAAHAYLEAGDLDGYARTMAAVGRVHTTRGSAEVGIIALEAVRRSLEGGPPSRGAITIHVILAWLYWTSGRYSKQVEAIEQMGALAEVAGDAPGIAWAEVLLAMARSLLGRMKESVPLLEAALPHIEQQRDIESFGLIISHLIEAYSCLGQFERFHLHSVHLSELSDILGSPIHQGYAYFWRGLHAFYAGDWGSARVDFEKGHSLAMPANYQVVYDGAAGYPFLGLGMLHVARGEDEAGRHLLEQALERAQLGLPPRLIRPVQVCLAEHDLFAGRPDEALGRLDPMLSSPEGREGIDATPLLPLLAWSYLELGNTARAEDVLHESLARCRAEQHRLALLDALRIQALLAIRGGRWDEGAAALDEALALAGPMPYPYAEVKALYVYGALESARGEGAKARERYERALAICGRLGERAYAQRIEARLAELPPLQSSRA